MRPTESCILCKSNNILKCAEVGDCFKVWRCQECTLTWIDRSDLARPESTPVYQDYNYNQNLRNTFEQMKPLYLKGFRERVERTVSTKSWKNCAFLDVGCANREYLWTAKEMGFGKVTGVEIDGNAAKEASVYGEVVDNVSKLPPSSFDIVQIKNVLSNIPDFVNFLSSCLKVLKPDGFLFMDLLNQDSLSALLRNNLAKEYKKTGRYGQLRPPYVINGFNLASLNKLYSLCGLTIVSFRTTYMGTPLLPYAPNLTVKLLGVTSLLLGKGTMLITEAKLITTN